MSTPSIEDVLASAKYDKCADRYIINGPQFRAILAHLAEHTDEAAEAVAELAVIQNLAMEHMNCSGCPTPWWLKQALGGEQ